MPPEVVNRAHPADVVQLVSIFRIASKKRIDIMIDAVAVPNEFGIRSYLRIAGDGDGAVLRTLRRQIESLGLATQVEFLGEVPGTAKDELLAEADLFLLPSDDENFKIGLAEALSHGVPSVASSSVAAAHFMKDRGGIVSKDPGGAAVAGAVAKLVQSSDWQALRASVRAVALASFSWDAVSLQWRQKLHLTLDSLSHPLRTTPPPHTVPNFGYGE